MTNDIDSPDYRDSNVGEGMIPQRSATPKPRAGEHTKGPWEACNGGKCKCGQIWSKPADHPVAEVTRGSWGDNYPTLRFTEDSTTLHTKVEAHMEQITYGEVSAEAAEANARRIVACVNACDGIETEELESGAGVEQLYHIASAERDQLRAREKELVAALELLTTAMETVARGAPELIGIMPGLKWMPEKARELLSKVRGA